jgi:hypothetical protein
VGSYSQPKFQKYLYTAKIKELPGFERIGAQENIRGFEIFCILLLIMIKTPEAYVQVHFEACSLQSEVSSVHKLVVSTPGTIIRQKPAALMSVIHIHVIFIIEMFGNIAVIFVFIGKPILFKPALFEISGHSIMAAKAHAPIHPGSGKEVAHEATGVVVEIIGPVAGLKIRVLFMKVE